LLPIDCRNNGGESTGAYSYRSDNPAVATVDATGKVTITGAGTANIYVKRLGDINYTDSPESTPIRVTVNAMEIIVTAFLPQSS